MKYFFTLMTICLLIANSSIAQNSNGAIDVPGDIAIVAFHDNPDGYSFILLDDCPAGVSIQFTDKEWNGSAFESGEGGSLWTNNTGGVIPAGTVIDIQNADTGGTASIGSVTENDSGFTLGTTGEQLYAVTGTIAAPGTFLAFAGGLNGNNTATLAGTGLVDGQTAVVFADNEGYYMGSTTCNGSVTDCAAMINTVANWSLGGFTFPTDVPDTFTGTVFAGCMDAAPPTITCPMSQGTETILLQLVDIDGSSDYNWAIKDAGNNTVASGTTAGAGPNQFMPTLNCGQNYTIEITFGGALPLTNLQVVTVDGVVVNQSGVTNGASFAFSVSACAGAGFGSNNDAGQCSAAVSGLAATATDDCTASPAITYTLSGATTGSGSGDASGSSFNVGTTTLTYTATDDEGNTATCSVDVTVSDTEAPTANCPSTQTVGSTIGMCGAMVSYTIPNPSDNCSATSMPSLPSGSFFSVGTTSVTVTATDGAGNTANCSFDVTVNDTEDPTANCPANQTVNNTAGQCGANVSFTIPNPTDNCPGATSASSPASGDFFPVGMTSVTVTATDGAGNTATCSFNVTVNDSEAPTANCPSTQTVGNDPGLCGATVNFILPNPTDNCPGATAIASPASGSYFNVGTTPVTVTATDAAGNTANCSFNIVVNDTEDPNMVCNSFNLDLTGTTASITATQMDGGSTDNCSIVALSASPNTFTCNTLGAQTVTLTGTDAAGNSSSCMGTVTVVDNSTPNAVCANPTVNLTSDGTTSVAASFFDGGSSAGCSVVTFSASQVAFDCSDVGNTIPVTLTVTAVSNGQTATCTANVTIADPQSFCCAGPNAVCSDVTVQLDANGAASVTPIQIGMGSTTDCGFAMEAVSPNTFDCSNTTAPVMVTYTIEDINGATSNCTANVTVEDNMAPVANCPSPAAGMNILNNPSFETNGGNNTPFGTDYGIFGAVFALQDDFFPIDASEGDYFLKIFGGVSGVTQSHPMNAGETVTATVDVMNAAFDPMLPGCFGLVKVEFYNSSGGKISEVEGNKIFHTDPQDQWFLSTVTAVAPPGTVSVLYVAVMVCPAGGAVMFDNATMSIDDGSGPPTDFILNNDPGLCGAIFNYTIPAADDNCSATSVADIPSGSLFDVGMTAVTVTATDGAGNSSTCSFNVIVNDVEAPVANCPTPPDGSNLLVNPSFENNDGHDTPFSTDYGTFGAVFVLQDNFTAPVSASDGNSYLKIFGAVSGITQSYPIAPGQVVDASVDILSASFDPMLPGCFGLVKVEFFDANGIEISETEGNIIFHTIPQNEWTPSTVTATAPAGAVSVQYVAVMLCPAGGAVMFDNASLSINGNNPGDFTLMYDPALCGATVSFTLPASTDNCPGVTTSTSFASGSFLPVGTASLVLTATDASGNTSDCTVNIEIEDTVPPTMFCMDQVVEFNGEDMITVPITDLFDDASSFDNCSAITLLTGDQVVTCDQLGEVIPVLVEGEDDAGNVGNCIANITVSGLPCGWMNTDGIGCDGNNDASFDTNTETFTVTSDGCTPSFPYISDSQSFVKTELCGDGYIKAYVSNVSGNGFAGVELRNSLDPGTKKMAIGTNRVNRIIRIARVLDNYPAWPQEVYSLDKFWVKIERSGNYFRAYASADDVTYVPYLFQAIQMDACTQVGLFVYSKAGGVVTADFTNVEVVEGTPFLQANETDVTVSTSLPSSLNVGLSPNPAKEEVRIDLNNLIGQDVDISIYNINGQLMTNRHIDYVEEATEVFALDRFPAGTYYVNIKTAQEQQSLKLIKQ